MLWALRILGPRRVTTFCSWVRIVPNPYKLIQSNSWFECIFALCAIVNEFITTLALVIVSSVQNFQATAPTIHWCPSWFAIVACPVYCQSCCDLGIALITLDLSLSNRAWSAVFNLIAAFHTLIGFWIKDEAGHTVCTNTWVASIVPLLAGCAIINFWNCQTVIAQIVGLFKEEPLFACSALILSRSIIDTDFAISCARLALFVRQAKKLSLIAFYTLLTLSCLIVYTSTAPINAFIALLVVCIKIIILMALVAYGSAARVVCALETAIHAHLAILSLTFVEAFVTLVAYWTAFIWTIILAVKAANIALEALTFAAGVIWSAVAHFRTFFA